MFINAYFRDFTMNAFLEKHIDKEKKISEFKIPDHYIYNFKERKYISSRTSHPKRRSDADIKRNIEWEKDIGHHLSISPRDRILNCDETSWQFFPNSVETCVEKGSQNVQIHVNGNSDL